jgi:hypothetical protein
MDGKIFGEKYTINTSVLHPINLFLSKVQIFNPALCSQTLSKCTFFFLFSRNID